MMISSSVYFHRTQGSTDPLACSVDGPLGFVASALFFCVAGVLLDMCFLDLVQ